jgi:hypothetical protein
VQLAALLSPLLRLLARLPRGALRARRSSSRRRRLLALHLGRPVCIHRDDFHLPPLLQLLLGQGELLCAEAGVHSRGGSRALVGKHQPVGGLVRSAAARAERPLLLRLGGAALGGGRRGSRAAAVDAAAAAAGRAAAAACGALLLVAPRGLHAGQHSVTACVGAARGRGPLLAAAAVAAAAAASAAAAAAAAAGLCHRLQKLCLLLGC